MSPLEDDHMTNTGPDNFTPIVIMGKNFGVSITRVINALVKFGIPGKHIAVIISELTNDGRKRDIELNEHLLEENISSRNLRNNIDDLIYEIERIDFEYSREDIGIPIYPRYTPSVVISRMEPGSHGLLHLRFCFCRGPPAKG